MQQEMFNDDIDLSKLSDNDLMKAQLIINQEMVNYLRELHKNNKAIFIPTNTPSLKNSKEIMQIPTKKSVCCLTKGGLMQKDNHGVWRCSKCGEVAVRHKIASLQPSKPVRSFQQEQKQTFEKNLVIWEKLIEGKQLPYRVFFYFIRSSARIFDYNNASHILADMMTENGYYKDDDVLRFMPEYLGFHVDSNKPGAIITLWTPELQQLKNKIYDRTS
jgi:ribosomal protein L37AE/L43A